jgi:hypothetical protein
VALRHLEEIGLAAALGLVASLKVEGSHASHDVSVSLAD